MHCGAEAERTRASLTAKLRTKCALEVRLHPGRTMEREGERERYWREGESEEQMGGR